MSAEQRYRGVQKRESGTYRARYGDYHLGTFATLEEAIARREQAENQMCDEIIYSGDTRIQHCLEMHGDGVDISFSAMSLCNCVGLSRSSYSHYTKHVVPKSEQFMLYRNDGKPPVRMLTLVGALMMLQAIPLNTRWVQEVLIMYSSYGV